MLGLLRRLKDMVASSTRDRVIDPAEKAVNGFESKAGNMDTTLAKISGQVDPLRTMVTTITSEPWKKEHG